MRPVLDEFDLALLDALHLRPRASFEELGAGLGVAPTTAARRWRGLSAGGLAWVSSAPGTAAPVVWAVHEVRCDPGRTGAVADDLAARPRVGSVHVLGGDWSLHALLVCADTTALAALAAELGTVPGVRRARTEVVLRTHRSVGWHLDALDPGQIGTLTGAGKPGRAAPAVLGDDDRAVYLALQHDGRRPLREVGADVGRSAASVRRRVDALVSSGRMVFRADFARAHGGWPVHVRLWLDVPDDEVAAAGATLGAWPEVRVCLTVLGAANLLVTVQVHALDAVPALLARIAAVRPGVRVVDRALVLRPVKSWGRLLGTDGRATSVVPVDPWDGSRHESA